MQEKRSAVVLVVDRLGAGFLGPYGNTWFDTPAFNQLASQSLLCENALADGPTLAHAVQAYWQGAHVLWPQAGNSPALLAQAAAAGHHTVLVTDEPTIAQHELAKAFAHTELVSLPEPSEAAKKAEETHLARLFATALDVLDRQREPFLLWIHARGLSGPWDAPQELRRRFADDEDPEALLGVAPPALALPPEHDPDELFAVMLAYAGQVAVADMALGALLESVTAHRRAHETLLAVTAPRGFPLGGHGGIGSYAEALYGELIHVPLLLRFPQRLRGQRSHALVQPADLAATLAAWLGVDCAAPAGRDLLVLTAGIDTPWRDRLLSCLGGELAVRTPGWFLRQPSAEAGGDMPPAELFVKPDDYWEVNNVASRCGGIVEQLQSVLAHVRQDPVAHLAAASPPLPAELLVGPD